MKLGAIISLAALLSVPSAKADTVVDISAVTCTSCFGNQPVTNVNMEAQLVLESVTGTFFDSGHDHFFTGTVDEIVSITGTFNGNAVTFLPAPKGDGSWLGPNFDLGTVYFSSGGSQSWFENDGAFNLLETSDPNGDGFGTNTPIIWTVAVVSTPEASSFALLAAALVWVALLRLRTAFIWRWPVKGQSEIRESR